MQSMMKNEYVGWKSCADRLNMGKKSRKEGSRLGDKIFGEAERN